MRIAYMGIKGLPSKSGTERVIEAIITRMIGKLDITVYCDADYTPSGTIYKGVRLIQIPTVKGKHLKPVSLGIFSAFHALLFGRYDIVHMNGVENCFTLPLLKLKYRVVSTSHGIPGQQPIGIGKWSKTERFFMQMSNYPFLYLSDCATSISLLNSKYFYSQYGKNVTYIPNGVDCDMQVNREAARQFIENLGLIPNTFLLFIAGRIIELKGCHLLLKAMNRFGDDIPVVVIGDMNQSHAYSQKLRELARNRRVLFIPPIADRGLLFGILSLCKLFVFPSIVEGMSMMLLEAASLGVPMVCSDIPENKVVLGENITYFRSEDHNDLADKIFWALNNPDELENLAQTLKDWVRNNYSWDSIASRYETLYRQCLDGKTVFDVNVDASAVSSESQRKE
jgi:glycosyltransferase involved in cell wall biosynthesis